MVHPSLERLAMRHANCINLKHIIALSLTSFQYSDLKECIVAERSAENTQLKRPVIYFTVKVVSGLNGYQLQVLNSERRLGSASGELLYTRSIIADDYNYMNEFKIIYL